MAEKVEILTADETRQLIAEANAELRTSIIDELTAEIHRSVAAEPPPAYSDQQPSASVATQITEEPRPPEVASNKLAQQRRAPPNPYYYSDVCRPPRANRKMSPCESCLTFVVAMPIFLFCSGATAFFLIVMVVRGFVELVSRLI